jgi:hypothetical protein
VVAYTEHAAVLATAAAQLAASNLRVGTAALRARAASIDDIDM